MIELDFNKFIHKFFLRFIANLREANSTTANFSFQILVEVNLLQRKIWTIWVNLKKKEFRMNRIQKKQSDMMKRSLSGLPGRQELEKPTELDYFSCLFRQFRHLRECRYRICNPTEWIYIPNLRGHFEISCSRLVCYRFIRYFLARYIEGSLRKVVYNFIIY